MQDADVPFRSLLLAWGRTARRSFPWRETRDPWRVLVAEVLLQRSRGKTAARVYQDLFDRWSTPASLAAAPEEDIRRVIQPLGLLRRAVSLKALAVRVVDLGEVPRTVDGLLALPGVGTYAANATAAVAYEIRAPVVDGVTARVYRRFFDLGSEKPPSVDKDSLVGGRSSDSARPDARVELGGA